MRGKAPSCLSAVARPCKPCEGDDTVRNRAKHHSRIDPTLPCPDIADVAGSLLVWLVTRKVSTLIECRYSTAEQRIQQIGRDIELGSVVRCCIVLACSDHRYVVLAHRVPGRQLQSTLPGGRPGRRCSTSKLISFHSAVIAFTATTAITGEEQYRGGVSSTTALLGRLIFVLARPSIDK